MNDCCKQAIKEVLQSMLCEEWGSINACMHTEIENQKLYNKAKELGIEFDPSVIKTFDLVKRGQKA